MSYFCWPSLRHRGFSLFFSHLKGRKWQQCLLSSQQVTLLFTRKMEVSISALSLPPSPLAAAVDPSEFCTTREIFWGLSLFFCYHWWSLWTRNLQEDEDTPNICSPREFIPYQHVHQCAALQGPSCPPTVECLAVFFPRKKSDPIFSLPPCPSLDVDHSVAEQCQHSMDSRLWIWYLFDFLYL